VTKDGAHSQLSAASTVAATSLVVTSGTGFTASGYVTVYDGVHTETVAVSGLSTNTLTVAATTYAHGLGCPVFVTAAANAPTDYIPVTTFTPNDNRTMYEDKGYRGSDTDVYGLVAGNVFGSYGTGGDVFPDTIGWLLALMLGDVATTGGSAPYTHTFSAYNTGNGQPGTKTFTDYDAIQTRAFPGETCTDLSINITSNALLTWTATMQGYSSGTVANPTQSFSSITPVPVWSGGTTIGGTYTPTLLSASIDMKRNGTVLNAVNGNPNPYSLWVGPLSVTGKLTFVAEDETQLLNYLNNSQPSCVIDFTSGTSSALTEVKFQMSKCAYTAGTKNRGQDYQSVDITYTAVANTTDAGASGGYSPIKAQLQNARVSGTYA
jgi:hypothetical protein